MPKIISNYIEVHVCRRAESGYSFLLLKRSPEMEIYPGIWQVITGAIEENEPTIDAAKREVMEETGLAPLKIYSMPRVNTFYFEFGDAICLSPVFLAMTDKEDVVISGEHTEHRWVNYEEAVNLIHWPDQIESLNLIYKYLNDEGLFSKLYEIK
ncbi:MAG: NUDIX pyrophosphatase [Ignavibacteriae bacterium]|nr:MAG: NUDIX pyrophosphatase [Ignavibacteriota bacterium]